MATSTGSKSTKSKPEVVTDVARCRDVMQGILVAGTPIVVDMEGIRLNAIGPLTLLQLMTSNGDVYLLDIHENPDLILKGDIREVLESPDIRKIVHGCFSDSGALYHQFEKTKLENVFDTSVAHLVIAEHLHNELFPKQLRLADLVEKYGGQVDSAKSLQAMWMKDDNYWAKRPLTEEMIKYAAADVRMLYPDVYGKLLGLIEENKLWEKFQAQIDEIVNEQIDIEGVKQKRRKRKLDTVNTILKELETEKKTRNSLTDYTDDQQRALWESFRENVDISDAVRSMRNNLFRMTLNEMKSKMKSDSKNFVFKVFNNQEQEKVMMLSEKRTDEDQLDLAQMASTFLQEVSKYSFGRILNRINNGQWLTMKEKIQLMQVDDAWLTRKQILATTEEKEELIEEQEKDIKKALKEKAENYIYLRRNEKYLLRSIPYKNFKDDVIKKAKVLLMQDQ